MKQVRRNSGRFNAAVKHEPYSVLSGKRIIDTAERRARLRTAFVVFSAIFIAAGLFFMFF